MCFVILDISSSTLNRITHRLTEPDKPLDYCMRETRVHPAPTITTSPGRS